MHLNNLSQKIVIYIYLSKNCIYLNVLQQVVKKTKRFNCKVVTPCIMYSFIYLFEALEVYYWGHSRVALLEVISA